jgi:WD40 repeat protein
MSTVNSTISVSQRFFTIGGTLPANAPSYVERNADRDLLEHLKAGQFCYLLTSRQMGKSSLIVRTAASLRQAGTKVALLDLTQIGHNVTLDQWYDGLLSRLGDDLDLEDELDDFWNSTDPAVRRLGAMQRWMTAIRQVIVKSIPGNIVIFVDEIDFVRRLPFSSDEFFAGVRQMHNERTSDPELNRLTFCVVGVASPSDLINVSNTPFNIGHRVELTDFTPGEAERFVDGLRPPEEATIARKLLRRVLWWTGGHPYLTQRLCASIAARPEITNAAGVDRRCRTLFLSLPAADTTDDNLQYVRDRVEKKSTSGDDTAGANLLFVRDRSVLLRDAEELAGLLDLYGRIRAGKRVPSDETSPLIEVLRLAGLVAVRDNRLVVRNRIYRQVFDKRWIQVTMPGAELRRQKAAFRKGVIRAAGIAAAVILAIAVLVLKVAYEGQQAAFQSYSAKMIQVQRAFDSGDFASGTDLIRQTHPLIRDPNWLDRQIGKHDLLESFVNRHVTLYALVHWFDHQVDRHFDWGYLQARSDGSAATGYAGFLAEVRSVAISPDGTLVAAAGGDSTVRIFDIANYGYDLNSKDPPVLKRALVVLDNQGTANSWTPLTPCFEQSCQSMNQQLKNGLKQRGLLVNDDPVQSNLPGVLSVQFSPDGKWLAIGTGNWRDPKNSGAVYLWSVNSPDVVKIVPSQLRAAANAVAFKPQSKDELARPHSTELAIARDDNRAEFFQIAPDGTIAPAGTFNEAGICPVKHLCAGIKAAAYSPDGRTFAMAFGGGYLWVRGRAQPDIMDVSGLASLVFYDNLQILLGSRDGRIMKVNLKGSDAQSKLSQQTLLETGQGLVSSLAISGDRSLLLTTGSSGTVMVWKLITDMHDSTEILAHGDPIMLRGERGVDFSAAVTARPRSGGDSGPTRYLIVSGDADVTKGLPGGRVSFWVQQKMPGREMEDTWESQPSFFDARSAVPALAFSPQTQTCNDPNWLVAPKDRTPTSRWVAMVRGHSRSTEDSEIYFLPLNPCTGKPNQSAMVSVPTQHGAGTALAWSADGNFVASAADDGAVVLWDVTNLPDTQKLQHPVELKIPPDGSGERAQIRGLSFSPDGRLAAVANFGKQHDQGRILVWKLQDPTAMPDVISPSGTSLTSLETLTFSADGKWLAVCDSGKNVSIWTEANLSGKGKPRLLQTWVELNVGQRIYPQTAFSTVAFSPDGQWLAAGNSARVVAVWSTGGSWKRLEGDFTTGSIEGKSPTKYHLPKPPHVNAAVNAVAFSPDSEVLAYGTGDGTIHLWDITSQLPLPDVTGHSRAVLALAFSPDGTCLVSGSNDATLRFDCEMNQNREQLEIQHTVLKNAYDRSDAWDWVDFAQ